MSVHVISGAARGCTIEVPAGKGVRPTLGRIREALFNILAPRIAGARFLDLFAGSGANGIEALSRGCAHCTFVDNNIQAIHIIRRNLERTRLQDRAKILHLEIPAEIRRIHATASTQSNDAYDIVFVDPPYDFAEYAGLCKDILSGQLLRCDGIIVLEHRASEELPDRIDALSQYRSKKYGDTRLTFFERRVE